MTPLHRKTTYLVALATVSAAFVGFAVAGNAFGAEWTTYEGRVSAGQAYLLSVPADAESLQLAFSPGLLTLTGGSARATLFDPEDARVGHYVLDAETKEILVEDLVEGDYVLYVFDVKGGVLTASVKADEADGLELVNLETETESFEIAAQDVLGAFRAVDTIELDREPVFESLLYQGSANNLTGSVRSLTGDTFLVDMETGTAHGPGLFTSQSGSRATFPENFAAGLHTIDATADEFEGTLYLTVVNYVRPEAVDVPEVPDAIEVPAGALVFEESWQATAVMVPDGATHLDLGLVLEPEEEEDEDGGSESAHGDYDYYEQYAILAVYTPDDQLLGFVELDEETSTSSLGLPYGGEYVVFTYAIASDGVWATLDGGAALFEGDRHLRLVENVLTLQSGASPLPYEGTFEVDMLKAPLAAGVGVDGALAYAADLRAVIHTDAGQAETYSWEFAPAMAPFWGGYDWHFQYVGEELVAGPWSVTVEALSMQGDLNLYTLDYDRDMEADEPVAHEHGHE